MVPLKICIAKECTTMFITEKLLQDAVESLTETTKAEQKLITANVGSSLKEITSSTAIKLMSATISRLIARAAAMDIVFQNYPFSAMEQSLLQLMKAIHSGEILKSEATDAQKHELLSVLYAYVRTLRIVRGFIEEMKLMEPESDALMKGEGEHFYLDLIGEKAVPKKKYEILTIDEILMDDDDNLMLKFKEDHAGFKIKKKPEGNLIRTLAAIAQELGLMKDGVVMITNDTLIGKKISKKFLSSLMD